MIGHWMSLSPGARIGPFEVTVQIGEGGMGEVYKATDINLKRAVAIKVLPTRVADDAERLARFQREAEVLATLNHPNIAQIHGGFDILALPLDSDGKPQGEPQAVVQTDFDEHGGQFSPDGKWIAYVSIKSGRFEVYVQPIAHRARGEIRISTDGGDQVRWRPDGKELFYVARDGRLMAVPVRFGSNGETLEAGTPVPLFQARVRGMPTGQTQYAVSSDGQRFLMNTLIEDIVTSPITMILNWKPQP